MQQHAVPQNISSFEFKLIGSMTLKQFSFLGGGLLSAYLFYTANLPFYVKWPLVTLFGVGGATMAFLPLQERPLYIWFISFFHSIFSPTQRVWKKEPLLPDFLTTAFSQIIAAATPQIIQQSRTQLEAYLKTLPAPKSHLDLAEEEFLSNLNFDNELPPLSLSTPQISQTIPIPQSPPPSPKPVEIFTLAGLEEKTRTAAQNIPVINIKKQSRFTPLASEINFSTQKVISFQAPNHQTKYVPEIGQVRVRKLHFIPQKDQSILPIRGEKTLRVSEQFREKLVQTGTLLNQVISTLPKSISPHPSRTSLSSNNPALPNKTQPVSPASLKTPSISTPPTETDKLSRQNLELSSQLKNLRQDLVQVRQQAASENSEENYWHQQFETLNQKLRTVLAEKEKINQELIHLQTPVIPKILYSKPGQNTIKPPQQPHIKIVSPTQTKVGLPQLTNIPNNINGIVYNKEGNVMPDTILIVKDKNGNLVRALKTNRLGQFSMATPLPSGTYTVETEKEEHKFDIIEIELKGELITPIEIKAK